jgi:hypothetical protein
MPTPAEIRILQGRIKRLELLLRLSSGDRLRSVREELDRLYEVVKNVKPAPTAEQLMVDTEASAAGTNGIGGLYFQANSPPGLGRLAAIPLYLYDIDPQTVAFPANTWDVVTTSKGIAAADETNPTVIVNIPPGSRRVKGLRFRTPVIEWATMRVVSFRVITKATSLRADPADAFSGTSIETSNQRPLLLVKNLNLGGSANLFPQGEYVDATVYSSMVPEFCGLRDNPILESPNRLYLNAAVSGVPYTSMTFAMYAVVDVLEDTGYTDEGVRHMPGPYSRRGAQAREPNNALITQTK